jgi:hypothetical protein
MISGTAGYLMFGNNVSDAIMKDLLLPQYGFSIPLNQVATWMIVSRDNGRLGFIFADSEHTATGHQPDRQVRALLSTCE